MTSNQAPQAAHSHRERGAMMKDDRSSEVLFGIDLLDDDLFKALSRKKIGLLTNWAAISSKNLQPSLLKLLEQGRRFDFEVRRVFAPQHGYWMTKQANMQEWYGGKELGIEIFSLYGHVRIPPREKLEDLDVVLVDVQDVGARYYTYIWTLKLLLRASAGLGVEVWVLDRPNPIGRAVEGPVLSEDFFSFVGMSRIPIRHGMTIGELSLLFKSELELKGYKGINLRVVPFRGVASEALWLDSPHLYRLWVNPSPNMPSPLTALVYPGGCLLEGTNLSEGRGTTRPFEFIGAPGVDPFEASKKVNERLGYMGLEGVRAIPVKFVPTFDKHSGQEVGGIFVIVHDPRAFQPVRVYATIIKVFSELYEEFRWIDPPYEYEEEKVPIDILWGNGTLRELISSSWSEFKETLEELRSEEEGFIRRRKDFLLYK